IHDRLASFLRDEHGADVTAVVGSLSDRTALAADIDSPGVRAAATYLIEIKAAAIDVVAEAARERGARVVFCDNRPRSIAGEPDLDAGALDLAAGVVGVGASAGAPPRAAARAGRRPASGSGRAGAADPGD